MSDYIKQRERENAILTTTAYTSWYDRLKVMNSQNVICHDTLHITLGVMKKHDMSSAHTYTDTTTEVK